MKKVVICLFCLFLVGCTNNDENKNKEKVIAEIDFFSSKFIKILNDVNNISLNNYELVSEKIQLNEQSQSSSNQQSLNSEPEGDKKSSENITSMQMNEKSILQTNKDDVDWNSIKNDIEILNTSWNVAMLDLSKNNVQNNVILSFTNSLNATIIGIKNEDKNTTMTNISNLYSYIPIFLNNIGADNNKQNVETTKYYILSSYSNVIQNDWETAMINVTNAENSFLRVVNDTNNTNYNVNKTYLLIKDLQNSLVANDKELYLLKYKSLMNCLINI